MLLYKHGLYVIGMRVASTAEAGSLEGGAIVHMAVERFTEAKWLRQVSFAPPPSFKLEDHVDGTFGAHVGDGPAQRVSIEFSKERAEYARARVWHRTQTICEQRNGAVRVEFTCRNLAPVVSWVLEWGPHAKVLGPPALVDLVVEELDSARRRYGP